MAAIHGCSSYIFSSDNILDIKHHITPSPSGTTSSLVFADFDDTLTMSGVKEAHHLGGMQWRGYCRPCIEQLQKSNHLTRNPLFEYISLFIAKSFTATAAQGSQTAEAVKEWEELGCKVVIYTARGRSGANAWYNLNVSGVDSLTKKQLESAGISISEHPTPLNHSKAFENRMIFSQNGEKDVLLSELFAQKVLDPSHYHQVIFIDDKKQNVEKLSGPVNAQGISYVGMHYNYIEKLEAQEYDLLKSTIQLVNLLATQKLLTSEDLDIQCRHIEGISADRFFKDVLIQIDRALVDNHVYDQIGLDVDEQYDRIKKAVSRHFEPVDLFIDDMYALHDIF